MATVEFDLEAVHEHASRLYRDAGRVAGTYVLMGAILGTLLGASVANGLGFAALGTAVFLAAGGYVIGVDRAHAMRLDAQRLLCQAKIEANTRSSSSETRLALAKLTQAIERFASQVDAQERGAPEPPAKPPPKPARESVRERIREPEPEPEPEPVDASDADAPARASTPWLAADGSDPTEAGEAGDDEGDGAGWVPAPTPRPRPAQQFEYLIWHTVDGDEDEDAPAGASDGAAGAPPGDTPAAAAPADAEAPADAASGDRPADPPADPPTERPADEPHDAAAYVYDDDAVDDDAWMRDAVPADDEAVGADAAPDAPDEGADELELEPATRAAGEG